MLSWRTACARVGFAAAACPRHTMQTRLGQKDAEQSLSAAVRSLRRHRSCAHCPAPWQGRTPACQPAAPAAAVPVCRVYHRTANAEELAMVEAQEVRRPLRTLPRHAPASMQPCCSAATFEPALRPCAQPTLPQLVAAEHAPGAYLLPRPCCRPGRCACPAAP